MITIYRTEAFIEWLDGLRDRTAKFRIVRRLSRVEEGNLGDVKYFDGIGEMRIDYGPGYRLYFIQRGNVTVVLLCGGDKDTQQRDIAAAKKMARDWKEMHG